MTKPLITIAIPTYKRRYELEECLNSVITEIDKTVGIPIYSEINENSKLTYNDIQIIVSDNCSPDDTQSFMNDFLNNHQIYNISYFRNDVNLGMDGNFLNCINHAAGRYLHMLSDDDIVLQKSLLHIVRCIRTAKPDFIHLNSGTLVINENEIGIGADTNRNKRTYCIKSTRLPYKNTKIITNKNEFLKEIGIFITFISAIVYKTELAQSVRNKEKFLGSFFLQSHVEMLTMKMAKTICIIGHCCIGVRTGNTGGYNLYNVWIEEYKKLLLSTSVEAGFSQALCKRTYIISCKKSIRTFIYTFRLNNTGFILNNRKCLILNTWMYPQVWFDLYSVAFAPVIVLKGMKKLKQFIRNHLRIVN